MCNFITRITRYFNLSPSESPRGPNSESVGEPGIVSDTVGLSDAAVNEQRPADRILRSRVVPGPCHPIVDGSRFWAVLIGIDAYEDSALQGCVSDARLMENFLLEDLHVPRERIQCLLGPGDLSVSGGTDRPSRDNIVRTLRNLIDHENIDEGDAIIIYFAGHGTSYQCDKHKHQRDSRVPDVSDDGHLCGIEAICPIDRSDPAIPDISDREFNTILTQISRKKGNNITVILDCCFASGAAREIAKGERRAPELSFGSIHRALKTADNSMKDLIGYKSVSSPTWVSDKHSFVLLAACKEWETAKEAFRDDRYNGFFTRELIHVLRDDWKKETTYADLLDSVTRALLRRRNDQHPIFVGDSSRMTKPVWCKSHWQ